MLLELILNKLTLNEGWPVCGKLGYKLVIAVNQLFDIGLVISTFAA